MSTVTQEHVGVLDFSQAQIELALNQVRSAPTIGEMKDRALPHIQSSDLQDLWIDMVKEVARLEQAEVASAYSGFILGTTVVRLAAGGTLPRRQPVLAKHYAAQIARCPGQLETDFQRDYAAHPAALRLLHETLTVERAKHSAKLVLNVFGDLANPARPPFEAPRRPLPAPRRSSGQSFTVRSPRR